MAGGPSGWFANLVKVIMRSEILDESPEVHVGSKTTSIFSTLMKSEDLPFDEAVSAAQDVPLMSRIFSSEPLPSDDRLEMRVGRPSFLAMLFSREALPVDPAPEALGRGQGR